MTISIFQEQFHKTRYSLTKGSWKQIVYKIKIKITASVIVIYRINNVHQPLFKRKLHKSSKFALAFLIDSFIIMLRCGKTISQMLILYCFVFLWVLNTYILTFLIMYPDMNTTPSQIMWVMVVPRIYNRSCMNI